MRAILTLPAFTASLLIISGLVPAAGEAVSLDLNLIAPSNLQVFFLEDLNITGQAPSAEVFRATIVSDLPATECYLVFLMRTAQAQIARGQSHNFTLTTGMVQISNLELTAEGSPYKLEDYQVSDEAQQMQDKLVQTGYFPSDNYIIRLELYQSNSTLLAADEVNALITNPFSIQLLSPAGTPGAPALLGTMTPVFSWSSQTNQYLLKICEKIQDGMDPESVMQGRPNYETERSQPLLSPNFTYPASGVRPLEPGHTYYWQVAAQVQTSSGPKDYPSSIGAFTIMQSQDPEALRILSALQRILGTSNQSVMNELIGFQPSGLLRLDGAAISTVELENLAPQFESGQCRTTAIRTE